MSTNLNVKNDGEIWDSSILLNIYGRCNQFQGNGTFKEDNFQIQFIIFFSLRD